jgi:hypothetical protein
LPSTSIRARVAFDDLNDDGPEGDILIGNDGAGREIPSVHVQEGEGQANPLQIFRGQFTIAIGGDDVSELCVRKHGAAGDVNVMNEHSNGSQSVLERLVRGG